MLKTQKYDFEIKINTNDWQLGSAALKGRSAANRQILVEAENNTKEKILIIRSKFRTSLPHPIMVWRMQYKCLLNIVFIIKF